jgi:hypothetical protein
MKSGGRSKQARVGERRTKQWLAVSWLLQGTPQIHAGWQAARKENRPRVDAQLVADLVRPPASRGAAGTTGRT